VQSGAGTSGQNDAFHRYRKGSVEWLVVGN
jgi:hypothetical protein